MPRRFSWVEVRRNSYRVKRLDILTFNGASAEEIVRDGASPGRGFNCNGYHTMRWDDLKEEFDEDSEAKLWTKIEQYSAGPIRLALNKKYSSPLPLP